MGLSARQLAFAKRHLPAHQYQLAAKYKDSYEDVAVNMHHRNIQELLIKKGFTPKKYDFKAYHRNCNRGAHNSVDLWYDYLPRMGYGDDPVPSNKFKRLSLTEGKERGVGKVAREQTAQRTQQKQNNPRQRPKKLLFRL